MFFFFSHDIIYKKVMFMVVEVLVEIKAKRIDKTFTYKVPNI